MRTISPATASLLVPLIFLSPWAHADVFKCTGSDGKTSYSSTPCMAADAKETVVPIVIPPAGAKPPPGRDWAAENASINARVRDAEAAANRSAKKASEPGKSADDPDRAPTPDELAERQRAAAGRRQAEAGAKAAAADAAAAARANANGQPVPPVKK